MPAMATKPVRIVDLRQHHHEALEIVMLVFQTCGVVMRGPSCEIVLRRRVQAEQHGDIDAAVARRDHLNRARHDGHDFGFQLFADTGIDQIGLVEDDEIGRHQLILVDLGEWIVVLDGWIGLALASDCFGIVGETSGGNGGPIDHGDDAIDGQPRADVGPVERLHQRLRQSEARGLDENMLRRLGPFDQSQHGRNEILGDGAAEAAIRQLDDVLLGAIGEPATPQGLAIDADAAEFIDDDGQALPLGILQHVAE